MRAFTILITVAAALVSATGVAAAPVEKSFTRDGRTYVYTSTQRADGSTVLQGHEVGSRARFRLLVDGTRVSGQANGYPVSFRTAQPLVAAGTATN